MIPETHTIVGYNADGGELSRCTTPDDYDAVGPGQLGLNALDLDGVVESRVWRGRHSDGEPLLTVTMTDAGPHYRWEDREIVSTSATAEDDA